MSEFKDKFVELNRRIDVTSANRMNAHTRLSNHNTFSQWTVIFFSLGLILISIMNLLIPKDIILLDISLIFLSVAILTISTALTMSNYAARAEKFLDCGRELRALFFDFQKILTNEDMINIENYEKYQKEYDNILSRYENHKQIDHFTTKLRWSKVYNPSIFDYIYTYCNHILEYIIYIILIAFEISWLYFIFNDSNLLTEICKL